MANRMFNPNQYTLEKRVTELWAKVAIGAAGAPTLDAANSKGISSIVRNGTGDYTVTLQDKYVKTLSIDAVFQSATGLAASPVVELKGAPAQGASPPIVRFQCQTGGGSATDPASGETMYLHFVFCDSTAT